MVLDFYYAVSYPNGVVIDKGLLKLRDNCDFLPQEGSEGEL